MNGAAKNVSAVGLEYNLDQQAAILEWARAEIGDLQNDVRFTRFAGGQSNPTYRLDANDKSFVLRQKPVGLTLKGAHAVDREARVQVALEKAGFPVPHIYGLCEDESLIGAPFYVMDMVEGRIFWNARLPEICPNQRSNYFRELVSVLARLHRVDYSAVGLNDFGRQGGYIERQLDRWTKQYSDDEAAGQIEDMNRLVEWLPKHVPASDETSLIHGDFRLDNVIFHPTESKVVAVLDWELSTLGHPLADFAYHLMMYRLPPSLVAGLKGVDLRAHSLPTEREYVSCYASISGRSDVPDLAYFLAFNLFRFAAIVHGVKGRHLRGNAASRDAEKLVAFLPQIARIACEQAGLRR